MPPDFTIAGNVFPLAERRLELAGTRIVYGTVSDVPGTLDRVAELLGLRERAWPYWLEDWPATWVLPNVLVGEDPAGWPGPALDLGCGAGILGAWLRRRFGIEPYACDFNSDACRLAALNAIANGAAPGRARAVCSDMGAFPLRVRFGLVLAGEMLYARANHDSILRFLSGHLAPGGRCLLADPGRSAADGYPGAARAAGFAVSILDAAMGERRARVFELRSGAA
jgi:SAM-dependent methyltransferase